MFPFARRAFGCMIAACMAVAGAQEAQPAPDTAASEGDVITFKSGRQLKGMQVLRETARTVVVQVLDDLEPMVLSKKFVEHIDYDDITPRRRGQVDDGADEPDVIVAVRLSGEMHRNLSTPLPAAALRSRGEDYLLVLRRLSRVTTVTMEISESARAVPADRRVWKYQVAEGTNLESLLREHFLVSFPDLRVLYNYDKLVITTSDAGSPAEPVE